MLYVVVREIEQLQLHATVFQNAAEARRYYDQARYVCDNGPGEGVEDDPTMVSNCWLYVASTTDDETAKAMVRDGRATLLMAYA